MQEEPRTILIGMANALTDTKSKNITVKVIKQKVGKYLKNVVIQGDVIFDQAQEIASKCLELFPDDLEDNLEIKKRINQFTNIFPKLSNLMQY